MANGNNRFGPDNPHPLSALKTELVWEGKYDEYGNRRELDVATRLGSLGGTGQA